MTDSTEMREAFEHWAITKSLDLRKDKDEWQRDRYYHSHVDAMWFAWQAAQSVPVVGEPVAIVGDPIAILRREIGEDTWFDWTPVKPGSDEHQRFRAAGEMDYCEVYQRYTQSIPDSELERLRKDAELYRWLRDDAFEHSDDCFMEAGRLFAEKHGVAFDEAIDAAMQERQS